MLPIEKYLETYSLEELLELNDLTEVDIVNHLVDNGLIILPEIKPVDLDNA